MNLLCNAITMSGGRLISCTYPDRMVAPIFLGAEDVNGHRYGLLTYPFTTTRRATKNRSLTEHRFQIRFGDPKRVREEANPLAHDPAGVDITLVLAVDPELKILVGLDPLVYANLPMGISGYYRDENAEAVLKDGWAVWAREKTNLRTLHGEGWVGIESIVGFTPDRFLDYARFEALATSLGLDSGLRPTLADQFTKGKIGRHDLEKLFGLDAATILDIVESNFRLGVAVRGSVAEHHLGRLLRDDPAVAGYAAIDEDGMPDFRIETHEGHDFTIECKNALRETYKDGDAKVETQKTRDSGAGRNYPFDTFDIVAACMFSVTGRWTFRFKWARDLTPWRKNPQRIGAIQRIDDSWSNSLSELLRSRPK